MKLSVSDLDSAAREHFISHYVQMKLVGLRATESPNRLYIPLRSDETAAADPSAYFRASFISHYVQMKRRRSPRRRCI